MHIFFIFFLMIFGAQSFAQGFLVPGDEDYYVYQEEDFRLIYPSSARSLVGDLLEQNKIFKNIYEKEFSWELDERPTFILASPQNQIANGSATTLPRLHSVFFGGGAEIIDEFSVNSWLYTLLSHETAHLYQLNPKGPYAQFLKETFGPSAPNLISVLPPFTYVEHSNLLLPTFILEGNATFNEIRFGNGGRLYNGAARALLLQMAKTGRINAKKLINDHLDFPFGREKYLIGGFFFLDLARRKGVAQTNSFFLKHAAYQFNPFQLNSPFTETFNERYEAAIQHLIQFWQPLWETQKSASEKALFSSISHSGFTKDQNDVYFLTTDGPRLPVIHIYNLKHEKWTQRSINVPMGKLFRAQDGEFLASGSAAVNSHQIRAGLFGEGYSFKEQNLDKYFYNIQGEHQLFADAKTSFFGPDLYTRNGQQTQHIGPSASSGILDSQGQAYYFKQVQKKRTLHRGGQPLFSYLGYYGNPIEVEGTDVYFIGPVERGSSLFVWRNGEFYRLHESDTLIDASLLNQQTALITEITKHGYDYKIVHLDPKKEKPFEFIYFTENEAQSAILTAEQPKSQHVAGEQPYSSFSNWQFDGIDPYIIFGIDTLFESAVDFRFSDPLQYHFLNLSLNSGSFGQYGTRVQYINSRSVVSWDILAAFQKTAEVEEDPTRKNEFIILDKYDTWRAAFGLSYQFFRRPQWQSTVSSHFVYENEEPHILISDIDNKFTLLTQLDLSHFVVPFLGYSLHRAFRFELANEAIRSAPGWSDKRDIYGGQIEFSHDLFRESYLSASYQGAYTDSRFPIVSLDLGIDDFPYPSATQIQRNTGYFAQTYFEVRKASAEFKQVINWSLYSTKLPISIRRFALIASYNEYYGSVARHESPDTLFHEAGGGVEFEFLVGHRFPVRSRFISYQSSFNDEWSVIFTLGANSIF